MIKTITKVGNSAGLILDAALLDLAHLKVGDKVNVEVHESGTVSLVPVRPAITPDEAGGAARRIIRANDALFRRLA